MNRKLRTEILIKGNKSLSGKLRKQIEDNYKINVIEPQNEGLVMIKSRESGKNTLFYLGEVLVTECKVIIDSKVGLGIVKGMDEELAYNLAVIDAAYNAGLKETVDWEKKLLEEKRKIDSNQNRINKKILKTKVDFSTMDIEM